MSPSEERMQILQMIESGQITAEEGAKLLAALKTSSAQGDQSAGSQPRWFRVRVTDLRTGKNKMNINIPMALVDVGIKMGARFVPESDDIDLEQVRQALRSGQQGKIVDIEDTEDEERVEIFVE
jgi:predicted DNA-binding transcriptional regulator YafY